MAPKPTVPEGSWHTLSWEEIVRYVADEVQQPYMFKEDSTGRHWCAFCQRFEDGRGSHVLSKAHISKREWETNWCHPLPDNFNETGGSLPSRSQPEVPVVQFPPVPVLDLPTPPAGERTSWTWDQCVGFCKAESELFFVKTTSENNTVWCGLCGRRDHRDGSHFGSAQHVKRRHSAHMYTEAA